MHLPVIFDKIIFIGKSWIDLKHISALAFHKQPKRTDQVGKDSDVL